MLTLTKDVDGVPFSADENYIIVFKGTKYTNGAFARIMAFKGNQFDTFKLGMVTWDASSVSWNDVATKSDLNTVLMYRGVITGDLNRGRNLTIAPGIYSIQGTSTIINGPSDFAGWGIFVQFPDNLFSQMILNSPNYIKFRKYSGSNPSWGAW